ncbi:hypothetical protein KY331_00635 [Candidatus Woesearchaeota archaeon]|nr:hypothetical protein [Candidatus Woesearchaeota archaeon]
MEFRKLISFGKTSFVMSIPKTWIVKNKLQKGDLIGLEEKEGNLLLSPKTTNFGQNIEKTELDVTELDPFLFRSLAAVYKSGYDEVELKFDSPDLIRDIPKQMTDLLPGYELLEQSGKRCVIKDLGHQLGTEFNNVLRRLFIVTVSMAKTTLETLKEGKKENLPDVLSLEQTNNRLCNFCERILNKKGYKNYKKTTFVYNIVWELEKVADQLKYMCTYLYEAKVKKVKISKEALDLFRQVTESIVRFYELFYKYDKGKIRKLAEARKSIIHEANVLFERKTENRFEVRLIHHLINIQQMVFNMLGCYLGMVV